MKKIILIFALTFLISSCSSHKTEISSPNKKIRLAFNIDNDGFMSYNIKVNDSVFIDDSQLGFEAKDGLNLKNSFEIIKTEFSSKDETWEQIWGENKVVRNHYNEMAVHLANEDSIFLIMRFRLFDYGLGFRYEYRVKDTDRIILTNELTTFNIKENGISWSIPASFETYELLYRTLPLNEVDDANTPFTFKMQSRRVAKSQSQSASESESESESKSASESASESIYASIHEAALTDFPEMTLKRSAVSYQPSAIIQKTTDHSQQTTDIEEKFSVQGSEFKVQLAPYPDGVTKAIFEKDNFITPWRTIQISNKAVGLINSNLILNLNKPCALEGDLSWIKPMKYVGVWWGMHLGIESWVMDERHGATTENAKRYIDFAANNNIDAVLFEGWNEGWESWGGRQNFDFTKAYADFDIDEIMRYAKEKNIEVIGHHETGGNVINYENQLEEAYRWTKEKGINCVKTGYAGGLPDFHNHHGQYNVRHYRKVVETAARHQITLDVHEPIKATGIRRTYPNMMTREGARGMEWNAWSEGNPPEHHVILPFTRLLAGPIDYTPGTFDILFENTRDLPQRKKWNDNDKGNSRVNTTLAKQLANWVVLYSPLQMASDMIEHYEGHPAFQFFRDFNPDCDWSEALQGEPGEYVVIVRRAGEDFFLGAITDGEAREVAVPLDFLANSYQQSAIGGQQSVYEATIYSDGDDAHWETNPTSYKIENKTVSSSDTLYIKMAAGGGCAVRFEVTETPSR